MRADKKFILAVLLIAIIIKCLIIVGYFYFWLLPGNPDIIGPDGEGFSQRGWYISKVLSGNVNYETPTNEHVFKMFYRVVDCNEGKLPLFNSRGNGLITYVIGFVYYIFGYVPLLIKFFNILISAASSVVLYLIALKLYNRKVARISILLFTFFPSIFMFSLTALRDPAIILCILAIVYILICLNEKMKFRNILFLILSLILILFLRQEMFIVMTFSALLIFLLNRRMKYRFIIAVVMLMLMLSATNLKVFESIKYTPGELIRNIAPIIFSRNAGYFGQTGRLTYKIFPEKYYNTYKKYEKTKDYFNSDEKITITEFIKYLPKGIAFYLTRPFPFVRRDMVYSLISLYMIWWYILLGLSLFGIFRISFASAYPVFIYIIVLLLLTSMGEVNEGILLRHRDSVAVFFIIFAAAAIDRIIRPISLKFNFSYE